MLSVKHGAEFAFAAEMFDALATVAERVVAANGLEDRVMVIHARSSDIDALPAPADIVVSELIDSSLLGEGCLPAHFDAIDRLLRPIADRAEMCERVLPYSATVYATLISSVEVQRMHAVSQIELTAGDVKFCRLQDTTACPGGRNLVPVHWAEMKQRGDSRELSASEPVLCVPFHPVEGSDGEFCELGRCYDTEVTVSEGGSIHGILLHWTLYLLSPALDPSRQLCYSSSPGAQNWQDHWKPCVYALPVAVTVDVGDIITIRSSFNTEKVILSISKIVKAADGRKRPRSSASASSGPSHRVLSAITEEEEEETVAADCTCGWHLLCGGERFQMMCDPYRAARWQLALDEMIARVRAVLRCRDGQQQQELQEEDPTTPPSASTPRPPPCLIIDASDGSLLSIATAVKINRDASDMLSADELLVVSKESKLFSRMFFEQLSQANGVDDRLLLWDGLQLSDVVDFASRTEQMGHDNDDDDLSADYDLKSINGKVIAVISECYYYQLRAFPRMQALSFYYYRASLHRQGLLHPRCITVPARGFVRAAAVELSHLYACHGPVHHSTACGLDHAAFNCEVQDWHSHWYPYKLADYQKRLLCEPLTVCSLDFENPRFNLPSDGYLSSASIVRAGRCDAVAVWVDYCLFAGDNCDLSMHRGGGGGGGAESSVLFDWPHYLVTNLKFFPVAIPVEEGAALTCRTMFQFGDPDFSFDFRLDK
jgi:protein arginine N-methyltransferase 7